MDAKTRLDGPHWMDELPIVLLGIRSTWKEDLDLAPALLTYGTNIRVPGDFLPSCADKVTPNNNFVRDLQQNLRKLPPPPPTHHGTKRSYYVPNDLCVAEHVCLA